MMEISLTELLKNGGFEMDQHDQTFMRSSTVNPKLNSDGDPIFEIPPIEFVDEYPDGLPEAYRKKYQYQMRQYMLLEHLWTVQLRNKEHRHYWNIKAAYDFWRQHGPKTFENRYYAWKTTWITDAMTRIKADINKMTKVGRTLTKRKIVREKVEQFQKKHGVQLAQAMLDNVHGNQTTAPTNSRFLGGNRGLSGFSQIGSAFRVKFPKPQQGGSPRFLIRPHDSNSSGAHSSLDNGELFDQLGPIYGWPGQKSNRRPAFSSSSSSFSIHTPGHVGYPRIQSDEDSPFFNLMGDLDEDLSFLLDD